MKQEKKRGPTPTWAKNIIAHDVISNWFDAVINKEALCLSHSDLLTLADHLKQLLNRANNAESLRTGFPVPGGANDLMPGEVLQQKTEAVLRAVAEYQGFMGDILQTPTGDVLLDDLPPLLSMILSIHSSSIPIRRKGRPPAPWNLVGRSFAIVVRDALEAAGYRARCEISEAESASILVATKAISWAYEIHLNPEGMVSAIRPRDRIKPKPRRSPPLDDQSSLHSDWYASSNDIQLLDWSQRNE